MAFRTRSSRWSICIGPGISLGAGPAGGVNLYKFRNDATGEEFNFAHLVLGVGASANLSGLRALGTAARGLLGRFEDLFTYGNQARASTQRDWQWLDTYVAFSGYDLDWSSAAYSNLGAGVIVGGSASVMHGYGRQRTTTRDFYSLRESGASAQLGASVFHGGGPLMSMGFY